MTYLYSLRKNIENIIRIIFQYFETLIKKKYLHLFNPYKRFVSFKILAYHGIGNQLFQYAVVRSYSIKNNVPLILSEPINHRLGDFDIHCKYVKTKNLKLVKKHIFREDAFCYNKNYTKYYDRKYFIGSFQTEKYFQEIRAILLKEMKLKDNSINSYCKNYIESIKNKNDNKPLVALHNRRGDNVPAKKNYDDKMEGSFRIDKHKYHPLLSLDYIYSAMSYFPNSVFLIFSNNDEDIKWCEKNINGKNIFYSKGHNDLIDFTLMKMCDHNIIGNSTFSWWAAWLNENPNKIVIVPRLWFGEAYSHFNIKDLIPNEWIVI